MVASQNVTLMKVAWYVLTVKNMHSGSPSDPSGHMRGIKTELHTLQYFARQSQATYIALSGKSKLSYIDCIIRQVKAELHILKLIFVFHHHQCWYQAILRVSTPKMYLWSGYFLVFRLQFFIGLWNDSAVGCVLGLFSHIFSDYRV